MEAEDFATSCRERLNCVPSSFPYGPKVRWLLTKVSDLMTKELLNKPQWPLTLVKYSSCRKQIWACQNNILSTSSHFMK
jgi:hypothetical protein